MTLLMFNLAPEEVVVLTDSLATTASGEPFLFVSKCYVIPHLDMVMAHSGVAALGQRWAVQLQTAMLARDIDELDQHSPAALRMVQSELGADAALGSSTIFHLGYSPSAKSFVGYAYRSGQDYASAPMGSSCFRVRPALRSGDTPVPSDLAGMVELAKAIRLEDDVAPDRAYIGGHLLITTLTVAAGATFISSFKAHRFDDYGRDWRAMNRNVV